MQALKVGNSKRGKIVIFDDYRYTINKKTPISTYLQCFKKCGVRMVANSNLSAVINFPGLHNQEEETEEIQKENIRQKMIQKVQKDPTKHLKEIYDNVLERNLTESCPEYHSVKSSLYRERRKELPPPPQMLTLDIRGRWKKR